jgi:hypothetical protein
MPVAEFLGELPADRHELLRRSGLFTCNTGKAEKEIGYPLSHHQIYKLIYRHIHKLVVVQRRI